MALIKSLIFLTTHSHAKMAPDTGSEPAFAGVLRQRLALKAAASCARLARLREDEG
jgi:Protein of unknown function (DUF1403)